jgi:serine/threonine protein kinase
MSSVPEDVQGRAGRYLLFDELASGGMAAVHLGRLMGSAGFVRTVAIKRLHATYAKDPDFVAMFTDEARLAARIRHPNVAATLDVVSANKELFLVMEYIHGESLSKLLRTTSKRGQDVPLEVAVAIAAGMLHGLHAAHEATTERGEPLGVVHRDVSPQNVMVGQDGVTRVVDFGVAKAVGRLQTTRDGEVKGKTAYMAPEQLRGRSVDRRADVYAASVVLWETLTGHRLFVGDSSGEVVMQVLTADVAPPSTYRKDVPPALDALVMRGLAREANDRFGTALELAAALERALPAPSPRAVGHWVQLTAGDVLGQRAAQITSIEQRDLTGLRVETLPTSIVPRPVRVEVEAPELPSQVSTISVTTPMLLPTTPSKRARLGPAVLLPVAALAGALAMALVGVVLRRPLAAPLSAIRQVPVPAEVVPDPPASASAPAVSTVVVVAPPSSASAAAAAPATSVASVTSVTSVTPRSRPAAAAKSTPRRKAARCDPPYTVDADGIHIPKAECE